MLSVLEVEKHNSRKSCWVIISGEVYDVTDFIDEHPGGAGVVLRYAGKVMKVNDIFLNRG
jgi:L-lactate dehydrogenase (cytochrome)